MDALYLKCYLGQASHTSNVFVTDENACKRPFGHGLYYIHVNKIRVTRLPCIRWLRPQYELQSKLSYENKILNKIPYLVNRVFCSK